MKYRFIIIIIGANIFSCQPKEEKIVEPIYPIVKSVLESIHEPMGKLDALEYNPAVKEDSYIFELFFNRKGQPLKESKFDSKGNLKSKAAFKYDGRGNAIHVDLFTSNGPPSSTITSKFTSSNKLVERNEVDTRDQLISKQVAEPDSDGNRIVLKYRRTTGRLVKTLECVFDERDLNILNNYFTKETFKNKDINTFDLNGDRLNVGYILLSAGTVRTIGSIFEKDLGPLGSYPADRTLKCSESNAFDADGNKIETIQFFPLTNKKIITRYKYFKNRMEVAMLTGNSIVFSKKIVLYDDKRNLLETFRYGLGGYLEEHQRHLYEFDLAGNWTKHKTIVNNKSVSVVIRQIEYF